jgi:hypothetical protein
VFVTVVLGLLGCSPVPEQPDAHAPPAATSAAPAIALGLGGTINGNAVFADADQTVAFLHGALGPDDSDSGWIEPECGPVGDVHWRQVRWGAFEILLLDTPVPQPDGTSSGRPSPHVAGWTYSSQVEPVTPVLRTAENLGLGSSRADVVAVYGDEVHEGMPSSSGHASASVFRGEFSNINFDFDSRDRVVEITSGQGGCGD